VIGDQFFSSGFANDAGIAITLADDTVVDQVGLSAGSAFKEGAFLPPLSTDTNQSYERRPGGLLGNGQDTNNNSADFALVVLSDPQNTQSSPTPGPTSTPSPTPAPSPSPSPGPSASPSPSPSPANTRVVISQVYGGGGNSGAPFRNDFIELFNAGNTTVDLSGWSVQYASSTASTWNVTVLTPAQLAPGQHYLVQEASGGSNGNPLPAPDTTGTIALAATAGKVALVRTTATLSGTCPADANIIDFVGYGTAANCFEGSGPAPAPGHSTATVRGNNGCLDAGSNNADFVTAPPNPGNSAAPIHTCGSSNLLKTADTPANLLGQTVAKLIWILLSHDIVVSPRVNTW